MLSEGVRFAHYTEPEQVVTALPGVELQAIPVRSGGFEAATSAFTLGNVILHVGRTTPSIIMAKAEPETAVVQMPFEGLETFLVNGQKAHPRLLGLYGPNGAMERVSQQCSRYASVFLPQGAVESLLSPPRNSPLLHPARQGVLRPEPQAWRQAINLAVSAEAAATADPAIFDAAAARRSLRSSLLEAVRSLIAESTGYGDQRSYRESPMRRRIIRAADEYLRANPAQPIYTEDLCSAIGVSATRVADAFHSTFDLSPHRFLKFRRLAMARTVLSARDLESPALSVRSVALMHGFWHLGQFAQDYRAHYGETPSATRARTRGRR